jgi:peptidoglycan/xylan/chitin deacetylase (PgdA/CDA1 family)
MMNVRLDRLASIYLGTPFRSRVNALPILMYHGISDEPEPGVGAYYRVRTPPRVFREHMHFLSEKGYRGVDLETALARPEERLVALTFDDGFADVYREAYPVMQEMGFTGSVFLPTAHIGDHRKSFKEAECLIWDEVRELHRAGWSFGSHTVNHPQLHDCTWDDIEAELSISREEIENELAAPVTTFAYPYAFPQSDRNFTDRLIDILNRTGYTASVTTRVGRFDHKSFQRHYLARLPINGLDDPRLYQAKLSGAYDWLASVQAVSKRLKYTTRHTRGRTV